MHFDRERLPTIEVRGQVVRSTAGRLHELLQQHAKAHPNSTLAEEREVLIIETLCALGRSADAHARATAFSKRHPKSAFIYATVLEGEIRSQVNDEPARVYKAGEAWTEQPGDHHKVSANASDTAPAKLLAIFVVDTSDKDIVIPDK